MDWILLIAILVFGLCLGSFLNVCIYRLPRGLSVVHPRSACPECRQQIHFYDNVPVLSWLLLGGRCRFCRTQISPRYALVELLTGALFVACFLQFGLTLAGLKWCCFGFLLLGLIFTDAETKLLPDKLTLTGLALGVGFSGFVPVNDLASQFLPGLVTMPLSSDASSRLFSVLDAVLGALAGASFIYGVGEIYFRARGIEGMGFGDVKLMAMIGAFLGLKLTVFTMFAASITGSLFGVATLLLVWWRRTQRRMRRLHEDRRHARQRAWQSARMVLRFYQMPFGVFLGGMALVALFFGDSFLRWYWRLM